MTGNVRPEAEARIAGVEGGREQEEAGGRGDGGPVGKDLQA